MRVLVCIVLFVACGGGTKRPVETPGGGQNAPGGPTADPIPSTPGPACSVVAEKLAIVALSDQADAQGQMRTHVKTRCTDDKWSDEARNCFATVENDQEIEGCKDKLTAEQRAAIGGPHDHGDKKSAASSAPQPAKSAAPPKKPTSSSVAPKGGSRSGDPCEGGE